MIDGISDAGAVARLARLPDSRLSRMIDTIRAQIPLAVAQHKDDVLARLQRHEWIVVQARLIKRRSRAFDR